MTKKEILNILEWSFVIFVALYMIIYGAAKFEQFGKITEYPKPLSSYNGMDLMWAFYSYSKTYVVILGIFEIIGSFLFLIPRTRIVGGFILSSILINVILQDYFYEVHRGAMANAIFYQILIFIVFFLNRQKLILLFKSSTINFSFSKRKIVLKTIFVALLLLVLMFAQEGLGMILNFLKI